MLCKEKNEIEELGLLGNDLRPETKACICRPNPTCVGFDLRMHAHGTHMQGCSKP